LALSSGRIADDFVLLKCSASAGAPLAWPEPKRFSTGIGSNPIKAVALRSKGPLRVEAADDLVLGVVIGCARVLRYSCKAGITG